MINSLSLEDGALQLPMQPPDLARLTSAVPGVAPVLGRGGAGVGKMVLSGPNPGNPWFFIGKYGTSSTFMADIFR